MKKTLLSILAAGAFLALGSCAGTTAGSKNNDSSTPASSAVPASSNTVASSSAPASSNTVVSSSTPASSTPGSSSSAPASSSSSSSSVSSSSSSSETTPTIGGIVASGDYDLKGVVACLTSVGYVLDDGTGALYVYKTLAEGYQLGDYVSVNVTVAPYFSIWEATAVNSIAKAEGNAPTLAAPSALTSAMAETWKTLGGAKDETTAPTTTASTIPLSLTAIAQVDSSGYTFFNVEGSTLKIEPSKLVDGITITTGVRYELVFYFGGYNSSKDFASIYVKSATAKYESVTGVSITGETTVMIGESLQLSAAVAPTGANPAVTWTSSDDTIATVSATGSVKGIAAGNATITATSVADTTKKATTAITVESNTMKSQAAFDLSKIPNVQTSASVTGAMDNAAALALFTGTTYITSGTNPISAVVGTKLYGADNTQGPKKTGLKIGASSSAGKMVLTSTVDIIKVVFTVYAWSSTKLANVTINGAVTALVEADATTARKIAATFDGMKTVTIDTSKYCVAVGIEFFVSTL